MESQDPVTKALGDQCIDLLMQLMNLRIAFERYKQENPAKLTAVAGSVEDMAA